MIFKIHYFAFNVGLSGVLVFITVFLRKYSDASSTEVGTLLMVLPFMAVFSKPFFCALADRHRRYKLYFILALLFTLVGFGAYTWVPFFPELIASHGRLCWYLLAAFTVVGHVAYGIVWSLGDAYAANVSHKTGESFGMIRLWGTIGWGVAGALVGLASPYLQLPEMVLGLIVFIGSFVLEILLLIWWPHNEDFEMSNADELEKSKEATVCEKKPTENELNGVQNELTLTLSCLESGQLRAKLSGLEKRLGLDEERTIDGMMRAKSRVELKAERQRVADLQWTIFKLVAGENRSLFKYLLLFTLLGIVYNIHWSYFFLHLDRLAGEGHGDFSTLVGLCLVAQAVGECVCFMVAPAVVNKLGRDGAVLLNALAFAVRYFGNGLGIPLVSPYVAVATESLQGINYGILYYLITDTALYYALQVDRVIPELHKRGLISSGQDLEQVRTSLRATMQGVFSGAFEGLGFGLGSLIAGLWLEDHSYEQLWCLAGSGALLILFVHAAYELATAKRR